MYIFLLVLGGGQDKLAWTASPPPGVKINRVGARYPGTACPPGASCPGGKINWDTGIELGTIGSVVRRYLQPDTLPTVLRGPVILPSGSIQ